MRHRSTTTCGPRLLARLIEEYGSAKGAADAVWTLARENEWYREGEAAERYLLQRPSVARRNEAALDLIVAWHGAPLGHLIHDGFEWRWKPADGEGPPLIRQTTPGKLPPFIVSLLPEGWLEHVLKDKDERTLLRSGKRYMSNITIVEQESDWRAAADILRTRLSRDTLRTAPSPGPTQGPGSQRDREDFERQPRARFTRGGYAAPLGRADQGADVS